MLLAHTSHVLSAPKAQYLPKAQNHTKGMDHVPWAAMLKQKVFSEPKAPFFSAAITYIAN
eukprot:2679134-Ditylum_brightwellii.AAC.1